MPSSNWIVGSGAISGLIAVAAGAFGAHALKTRLEPELLAAFETGARYQMYHALGLLTIGALAALRGPGRGLELAAGALLVGTLLFSGSLYALALSGQRIFGAVTPFGGFAFMAGWTLLAIAALRHSS